MDDITLKVDSGALLEVPVFERDECGKNWMAVIECRDKQAPGGFRRTFCERAGEPFFYFVAGLRPGQVVEFGADRVSLKRARRKQPHRSYGVVRKLTDTELVLIPSPTALQALVIAASPAGLALRAQRDTVRKIRE